MGRAEDCFQAEKREPVGVIFTDELCDSVERAGAAGSPRAGVRFLVVARRGGHCVRSRRRGRRSSERESVQGDPCWSDRVERDRADQDHSEDGEGNHGREPAARPLTALRCALTALRRMSRGAGPRRRGPPERARASRSSG
ncbi:hypothetical protein C5C47_13300 [Rathayibacter rathayi]|nr:hypothetical protein C5C47_13300 [Rathayibacter rathayi]